MFLTKFSLYLKNRFLNDNIKDDQKDFSKFLSNIGNEFLKKYFHLLRVVDYFFYLVPSKVSKLNLFMPSKIIQIQRILLYFYNFDKSTIFAHSLSTISSKVKKKSIFNFYDKFSFNSNIYSKSFYILIYFILVL